MKIKHFFPFVGTCISSSSFLVEKNKIISQARLKVWNRVIALFWG